MREPEDQFDGCCCCCCCCMDYEPCCCSCGQVCCPCMQEQICCCCHSGQKKTESRCACTQTVKEVKEQSTKISEMRIPKPQPKVCSCNKRRKCRCRRPVCCNCVRNTCPCVQPMCCSCKRDQTKNKQITTSGSKQSINSPAGGSKALTEEDSDKSNQKYQFDNEPLINYCLNRHPRKPTAIDFLNLTSNNFSTLHKSFDILLKNNINIMSLFDDKKELRREGNSDSCYPSNHTIACVSSDNIKKNSDTEHCKLLTAVCDAILSSHKFDNERYDSSPHHPKYVQKRCDRKDSQNSFNIFSSRGFLQKILSELNFPTVTRSGNDVNIHREMGVQAGNNSSKKSEMVQTKRSLTKLIRTKSRVLTAPRFPKKVENLKRSIDLLKLEGYDVKTLKKSLLEIKSKASKAKKDENKINFFKNTEDVDNKVESSLHNREDTSSKDINETPSRLERIEQLLNTIEYITGSTGECFREDDDNFGNTLDSLLQNSHNGHLLETTSPPLTDTEFPFNADEGKMTNEEKAGKRSSTLLDVS